jgi:hypothetical protein
MIHRRDGWISINHFIGHYESRVSEGTENPQNRLSIPSRGRTRCPLLKLRRSVEIILSTTANNADAAKVCRSSFDICADWRYESKKRYDRIDNSEVDPLNIGSLAGHMKRQTPRKTKILCP